MNFLNMLLSVSKDAPMFEFEPEKFIDMLPYMGKGMLVIFVIIGVIILATVLINKLFANKN